MKFGDRNQLHTRFGFISVVAILIGGIAATFGCGFGVNASNGQESDAEVREPAEIISLTYIF